MGGMQHTCMLLANRPRPSQCREKGCPGRPTFTKVVLCYYEGRAPAAQLDPCLCSHLVLTNAARFPSGSSSKAAIAPMTLEPSLAEAAASLKQRNSKLLVLARVSGGARAALTTPRAADVAAALAQLVRDARLDGLEVALDWQGARVAGGAHGKQRLVALVKGLRVALQSSSGDGRGGRHRRSYSVREEIEDDVPRPTWNSGLYIRSNGSVGVQTTSAPPAVIAAVTKPVGPLLLLQVSAKPAVLGKIFDLKPLARYVGCHFNYTRE
ncbi:hypothetical protein B566_EDAN010639 [Ephemera danica]|nr:hypothetical protein B566_EDAN010639 [Ephemera danica]